jgi:hypothetical protein
MAEPTRIRKIVYFKSKDDSQSKLNGPVEMYAIDAQHAVTAHPEEYSFVPWNDDEGEGPNLPTGELRPIVPTDWIDMKPSEKLQLARSLGAKDVRSGAAAEEFINGYLVERANAANNAPSTRPSISERPGAEAREEQRAATLEVQEGRTDPAEVKTTKTPPAPSPLGPVENNPK